MVLAGRTKLRVSKNFFGGYLFVFVKYLCNRCPKIKTKNIKNYSSILAIVNYRNWLDDSPPLSNSLCLYEFNRYLGMWSLWLQILSVKDFLKLLSVGHNIWICSIKVIISYNIVSMSAFPLHIPILSFNYITFSACQFKQVRRLDVDQMLHFTLEKHKKC